MLSKFQSNEKDRKNVNKKLVEYLLKNDFNCSDTRKSTKMFVLPSRLSKSLGKNEEKRLQWQNNPLYKTLNHEVSMLCKYNVSLKKVDKSTLDREETESRHSTASIKSGSKSILSFDSGFKSDIDDNDSADSEFTKTEGNRRLHSIPRSDFCEVSDELLKTFRDFENHDDDQSLQETLKAMAELLYM
uniref:BESS domain-containing protein n=1 Tax=Syphacia muris TaxID=451379 RepID=A0A0N5A7W9_9BILA